MLYLFLALKIPLLLLFWLVCWAVKASRSRRTPVVTARPPASAPHPPAPAAARAAPRPARATRCRCRRRASRPVTARSPPALAVGPRVARRPPSSPTARSAASSRRAASSSTRGTPLVQPASVDLRLGDSFRVFHNHRITAIDLREPPTNLTEEVRSPTTSRSSSTRASSCLGRTLECVELPDDIVARDRGQV